MTTHSFHRTMTRTRHMGAMYRDGFGYTTLTSQNLEEARGGQHEDNRNRYTASISCSIELPRPAFPTSVGEIPLLPIISLEGGAERTTAICTVWRGAGQDLCSES